MYNNGEVVVMDFIKSCEKQIQNNVTNEKMEKNSVLLQDSSSILLFNIRFSFYMSKLSSLLSSVQLQLLEPENLELVDDDVLVRERRMAGEFERRFSRVNLYSIHLKLRKLEKLIIGFRSNRTCKITLTFIPQSFVLSILKNLADSLQLYSKFIRKMKIFVCTKLRELLNYISHIYYIVHYIVDPIVLLTYNLPKLSRTILDIIDDRIISSNGANKSGFKKINPSMIQFDFIAPRVLEDWPDESALKDVKKKKKKNVRFEMCECESQIEAVKTSDCFDENPRYKEPKRPFRERLCTTTIRLCDGVIENLLREMIEDIAESIRCLVMESFDHEFSMRDSNDKKN